MVGDSKVIPKGARDLPQSGPERSYPEIEPPIGECIIADSLIERSERLTADPEVTPRRV